MTRAEAAEQYARALGDLLYAKVTLAAYPQSPSIREDANRAECDLAVAVLVLLDPTAAIQAFLGAPLEAVVELVPEGDRP